MECSVQLGAPPTGDHTEIMAALRDMNGRKDFFHTYELKQLSARGEYLDPWDHPYRIDTSNPQSPNVYSFGKNGIDEGGAEGSDDIASWR